MKIRKRLATLLAFVLPAAASLLLTGCRSMLPLPGQWLETQAPGDGRLDDFSRKITTQLFENGMMVGVGNDADCLYVFFSPSIRHDEVRFPGRAVLTVWIDGRGGKARILGLEHVSGPAAETGPLPAPTPGRPEPQAPELLKIIDRGSGKEAYVAASGRQGPAVRLTSDWGDYAYQLRIPLRASGDWPGLGIRPGAKVGIGLIWRSERPARRGKEREDRSAGAPGGERPGSADGDDLGNGPRGRRGGPGGVPGREFPSRRSIWLKAALAVK